MNKELAKPIGLIILLIVMLVIAIDIPIKNEISKCGVTVKYKQYVFNRIFEDIITFGHAADNDYQKRNAERELYRMLCSQYVMTNDESIRAAILAYFFSNPIYPEIWKHDYPNVDPNIDTICEKRDEVFRPLVIM